MRSALLLPLFLFVSFSYGQNVGIGETAPGSKLAVKGSLSIGSSYSTTVAPADGAIIQGNVGIGTASSSTTLTVATGSGHWQTALTILPTTYVGSSRAAIDLDDWLILQDLYGGGTKDFALYQNSSGQQRFVILTNGNTGIGTVTPGTLLDVNGALTLRETVATLAGTTYTIPNNVSQVRLTGGTGAITLTAPTALTVGGQRLVIYNSTAYSATFSGTTIPAGVALEFIYSYNSGVGTWLATVPSSTSVSADNGLNINTGTNVELGGTLNKLTTINQAGNTLNIGNDAAANTLVIGSTNTTSTTTIQSGSGGVNINTVGATGPVKIGNSSGNNIYMPGLTTAGVLHNAVTTGVISSSLVSLTADVSGILPLANGGTGANLSATGGAGQYLKQSSAGGVVSVGTIAAADLPGSFSGLANPTATIGLTAVNGSATTAMRSDAAPALSQAIVPTWTGIHTFSNTTASTSTTTGAVVVTGGEGIGGALNVGTSASIGTSLSVTGNAAVGGTLSVGGAAALSSSLTVGGAATLNSNVTVTPLSTAGFVTNTAAGLLGTTTTVPVTNGGTGTTTAFTKGSVVFAGTGGVYTQNNADFFWDNTNNRLGIGTATPQFTLHVYNPSAATSMVLGGNSASGGYTALLLSTSANTGGYSGLQSVSSAGSSYGILALNSSGGNVGVATASPLTTLDVSGNLLVRGVTTFTPTTPISAVEFAVGRQQNGTVQTGQTTADIALEYASGGYRHYIMTRHLSSSGSSNQNAIDFYLNNSTSSTGSSAPGTGNVNTMSITSAGVGVNTNAPTQILDVKGVNTAPATSGTTSTAIIRMENTTTNGNVLDMGNYSASPYGTWLQATDRTSLAATYPIVLNPVGGLVGVGVTAPAAQIDATGTQTLGLRYIKTGSADARIQVEDNSLQAWSWSVGWGAGNGGAAGDFSLIQEGTSGSRIYVQKATGYVGIGTVTPTSNLYVTGTTSSAITISGNQAINTASGSAYTYNNTYTSVAGHTPASQRGASAAAYQFGVVGQKDENYDGAYYWDFRSGGSMGSLYYSGSSLYTTGVMAWGSQGYFNSVGAAYGTYSYSNTGTYTYSTGANTGTGTGYLPDNSVGGIGSGAFGGVIGSWSRGSVMGTVSMGELFASYNMGDAYTSGHNIEIVQNGDKRIAAYSNTSTEATVNKAGRGQLSGGKASVSFDAGFAALLSKEEEPVVTVTPIGNCNGIHIVSISADGFVVEENNNGNANVAFTYIVMGRRVDASSASLPADIADKNFDANMKKVMFNENDKEHSASPVWWDGKKLRFDAEPKGGAAKK